MKEAGGSACFLQDHISWLQCAVRLSWSEHLRHARTLELSSAADRGTSLALMGMGLLILGQDLLELEKEQNLSAGGGDPLPAIAPGGQPGAEVDG